MRSALWLFAACLVLAGLLAPAAVHADPGVGVNLGRIQIDDRLAPGGGYSLPTLGVTNTGDEPGDYEVVISYVHDQKELRPPAGWVDFQPREFFLEPGQTQNVRIRLTLPTGADPGDYFAFLEAHPVAKGNGVSVGVAAATRLSFTVKPANWFEAQRVLLNRFIDDNEPWSFVVPGAILVLLLLLLVRKFFRIGLRVERR
jgi:hypothetical protein